MTVGKLIDALAEFPIGHEVTFLIMETLEGGERMIALAVTTSEKGEVLMSAPLDLTGLPSQGNVS